MLDVFSFRMRIEGLLIKEEFNSNMEWIRPSIEAVIQAAKGRPCASNSYFMYHRILPVLVELLRDVTSRILLLFSVAFFFSFAQGRRGMIL